MVRFALATHISGLHVFKLQCVNVVPWYPEVSAMRFSVSSLTVACLTFGGCDSPETTQMIELAPPNVIVVSKETRLAVDIPPGMEVAREILVGSEFPYPLTGLRTHSSCGCTSAALDGDTLGSDEFRVLRCVYEGGSTPKTQNIRVRIFAADVPSGSFEIGLRFRTDPSLNDLRISSMPAAFAVDDTWSESLEIRREFRLTSGVRVPLDLEVSGSAEYISTNLRDQTLTVSLHSPPVGSIDEAVSVSYRVGADIYTFKLPIRGIVKPPVTIQPDRMDFSDHLPGRDMRGEFRLTTTAGASKPNFRLDGDFAVQSLKQLDEQTWQLCFGLKSIDGPAIRYGDLVVEGGWNGEPTRIPITGSIREQQ